MGETVGTINTMIENAPGLERFARHYQQLGTTPLEALKRYTRAEHYLDCPDTREASMKYLLNTYTPHYAADIDIVEKVNATVNSHGPEVAADVVINEIGADRNKLMQRWRNGR
jgi:hypothetical protein